MKVIFAVIVVALIIAAVAIVVAKRKNKALINKATDTIDQVKNNESVQQALNEIRTFHGSSISSVRRPTPASKPVANPYRSTHSFSSSPTPPDNTALNTAIWAGTTSSYDDSPRHSSNSHYDSGSSSHSSSYDSGSSSSSSSSSDSGSSSSSSDSGSSSF